MKAVIQRGIPLNQTFKLVESFYSELENGNCCDNCGKLIANIAKVKGNTDGREYYVGMDCADTLQGLKSDPQFTLIAQFAFSAAKSARASILKLRKKAKENNVTLIVTLKTFEQGEGFYKENGSGMYSIESEPFDVRYRTWKQFPAEYWMNHVLPMIKNA